MALAAFGDAQVRIEFVAPLKGVYILVAQRKLCAPKSVE